MPHGLLRLLRAWACETFAAVSSIDVNGTALSARYHLLSLLQFVRQDRNLECFGKQRARDRAQRSNGDGQWHAMMSGVVPKNIQCYIMRCGVILARDLCHVGQPVYRLSWCYNLSLSLAGWQRTAVDYSHEPATNTQR